MISSGNRTGLSPIRYVIIRVRLQTELDDTKFCYQLIITLTKFVIYKALFLKSKHKIFQDLFFASSEKRTFKRARDGAYCPITWA